MENSSTPASELTSEGGDLGDPLDTQTRVETASSGTPPTCAETSLDLTAASPRADAVLPLPSASKRPKVTPPVQCPLCGLKVPLADIQEHVQMCLGTESDQEESPAGSVTAAPVTCISCEGTGLLGGYGTCPLCDGAGTTENGEDLCDEE